MESGKADLIGIELRWEGDARQTVKRGRDVGVLAAGHNPQSGGRKSVSYCIGG